VTAQIDLDSGPARLYRDLLDAWNRRDAAGMAALFTHDGSLVGFDGSQIDGGPQSVQAHLAPIFSSHATPAYVGKVREVRQLAPKVSLVRAVTGMVPEGRHGLNPALNTIHTLVAVEGGGTWRAAMFQSTPAAFHGRPDLAQALSEELRALVACLSTVLSELESRVLSLYLDGHSYTGIGELLGCDCKTVDNALQRVKRKVGAHLAARNVML
jgi:uncharacterized protein (TIGR02246 family)